MNMIKKLIPVVSILLFTNVSNSLTIINPEFSGKENLTSESRAHRIFIYKKDNNTSSIHTEDGLNLYSVPEATIRFFSKFNNIFTTVEKTIEYACSSSTCDIKSITGPGSLLMPLFPLDNEILPEGAFYYRSDYYYSNGIGHYCRYSNKNFYQRVYHDWDLEFNPRAETLNYKKIPNVMANHGDCVDHFGYSNVKVLPVYSFRHPTSGDNLITSSKQEAVNAGYTWVNSFYVYSEGAHDTKPLYRCRVRDTNSHFVSITNNCEGQIYEGIIGHILKVSPRSFSSLYRQDYPLARFHNGSVHLFDKYTGYGPETYYIFKNYTLEAIFGFSVR